MTRHFIITGSGRCGTKYAAKLLSAAGVKCGHEKVFNANGFAGWGKWQADSSWMAATHLPVSVPVVLLVRHPLLVVKSWVEIGFFTHDLHNPTHAPLRRYAPGIYDRDEPADRALAMWCALTGAALREAECLIRLESLDADVLARLLRWAGGDPERAREAFLTVARTNRHERQRARVGVTHEPSWAGHDPRLIIRAQQLAQTVGYDPEVIPGE